MTAPTIAPPPATGITPEALYPDVVKTPWYKAEFFVTRPVKLEEIMNLSRQLSSFLRAGIPAVDFIDWSYDGHSLHDGLRRLSPAAADAVGETVVALLRAWR